MKSTELDEHLLKYMRMNICENIWGPHKSVNISMHTNWWSFVKVCKHLEISMKKSIEIMTIHGYPQTSKHRATKSSSFGARRQRRHPVKSGRALFTVLLGCSWRFYKRGTVYNEWWDRVLYTGNFLCRPHVDYCSLGEPGSTPKWIIFKIICS